MKFIELNSGTIANMLRCWENGIEMPHIQALEFDGKYWTCLDNRAGEFFMECFAYKGDAIYYLTHEVVPSFDVVTGRAVFDW